MPARRPLLPLTSDSGGRSAIIALGILLGLVLGPVRGMADGTLPTLPLTSEEVVDAAVSSGLIAGDEFEAVDDPQAGPLLVGRPAAADDPAKTFSIVVFEGDEGPVQVQFIMTAPWDGLQERLELAGAIAALVVAPPDTLPPVPPVEAGGGGLSPAASWLYSLFYESWLGWPGAEQRQVRVRNGIAVITEGTPPESWTLTLAVDRDYPDATWPGRWPRVDSGDVSRARRLVRSGEYREAALLLEPLAAAGDPTAAVVMGDMERFGRLGAPRIEKATDWYLIAGRYRHPLAIWSIAAMLTEGWGTFFISNMKGQLLPKAEAAGSADALYVLGRTEPGVNYTRPQGVTAFDQILRAARWGLLSAQHDVARRYREGDGVDADPVEACAWALAALENTGPGVNWIYARQLVDDLAGELDAAGMAAARARAPVLVTGPPAWPPSDMIDSG